MQSPQGTLEEVSSLIFFYSCNCLSTSFMTFYFCYGTYMYLFLFNLQSLRFDSFLEMQFSKVPIDFMFGTYFFN